MAKIFITGSTDGLGFFAARQLMRDHHQVYLHARSEQRAKDVQNEFENVVEVLIADLSNIEEVKRLAHKLNQLGKFDAIIHNAGVFSVAAETIFQVNVLAPYILSALVHPPERLIYLSSGMHRGGKPLQHTNQIRRTSYSDSKLQLTTLMKAVARLWPAVFTNAVDPGWVPTKMGGSGAPDDLESGFQTQIWLSTSQEPAALVSGQYFFHGQPQIPNPSVNDVGLQDRLLQLCKEITGIAFPS